MSYRLINANDIAFNSDGFITAGRIEKMPCIYADLPNGMDGEHYALEQEPILDKIRAEINKALSAETISDNNQQISDVGIGLELALSIINKYKAEGSDKE